MKGLVTNAIQRDYVENYKECDDDGTRMKQSKNYVDNKVQAAAVVVKQ